ncbi:MAG: InlB B-repeat-containing protein, partial [Oscillospiraceae bacterium]
MFNLKRAAALTLSLAMLLPTVPTAVRAEETNTWKFDLGYADYVEDGYIKVTPDMNYFDNTVDELQFGFLGITDKSYSESYKYDGYTVAKGQKITLKAGGTQSSDSANSDYIAVPSASEYLPEGASSYEGRYPIRFAMKVTPKTYYTVKATLANSSATENAVISLQSEKRHIIDNNIELEPNQTKTYTFNVDVEDYRYKSEKTAYEDDMLNIIVAGKNAALASLEVTKHEQVSGKINGAETTVNDGVTLWCCDDSTGCDQVGAVPYFELQNYAGVCQELSKYVPDSIAVSNQGEGGLATNDTAHLAQCYLKEGDYLYVQYGHNENSAEDYKSNLENYYTTAHKAGAKLIVVSPVERHNTWDETSQMYKFGFGSYITAAKDFVDTKISNGATDIAFVDLNTEYIEWMNTEIARINGINENISKQDAIEFYYRSVKGSKVDTTHVNDAGADQGAIAFFKAAQKVYDEGKDADAGTNAKIQSDVLAGLVTNWHSERTAYTVSDDVILAGKAPNSYWDTPVTNTVPYKYDIAVTDAQTETSEENGKTLKSVTLRVQNDLNSYAKAVVTVTSGEEIKKYYSTGVVDNTADTKGTLKTFTEFSSTDSKEAETVAVTIPDGAICTIQAYEADLTDWTVNESAPYSIVYTVKNVTGTVLTEDGADIADWSSGGSAGNKITAVTDEENTDAPYMNVTKSSSGSSAFKKTFDTNITGGMANVKLKMRYNSGYVRMSIANATNSGATYFMNLIDALTINDGKITINNTQINTNTSDTPNIVNAGDWFDIDCIIDYDNGIASISVAGSNYVTVDVSGLQKNTTSMLPVTCFGFETPDSKSDKGYDCDIKDISITTIERTDALPKQAVTAKVNDALAGTVTINGEAAESAEITRGEAVTFKAIPNEGYEFVNWTDESGAGIGTAETYAISRLYEGVSITANFKSSYGEGYMVQKIAGLSDDFEGTAADGTTPSNIFGVTEKSIFGDTVSISGSHSIVPTSDKNSASIYGNVLAISVGSTTTLNASVDAIELNERQTAKISLESANGYLGSNRAGYTFKILDSSDTEIVGFDYESASCKINAVRIGGTAVTTDINGTAFSAFSFNQANAVGDRDFTKPIDSIEIEIGGDKNVIIKFNRYSSGNLSTTYTYTGTLSEGNTVSLKSVQVTKSAYNSSNRDRSSVIDNIKTLLVTAPETHKLTVEATDIKENTELNPTVTLTDSNGNEITDDFTALYGTYTYKAELDGYHTAEGRVSVYDQDETLTLEMIPNTLSAVRSIDEKGSVLKTTVADSAEDTVVYYPAIIQSGDKYYKTTANTTAQDDGNKYSYGKYSSSAAISDVAYTELSNCVYYAEAENILTGVTKTGTSFSQGKSRLNVEGGFKTDTLPAGTYGVYVGAYMDSNGNAHVYVTPPSGTKSDRVVSKNSYSVVGSEFTLANEGAFTITNNWYGNLQFDYIYILALTPQDAPEIAIDYENETLTGFDTDGSYTIGGSAITPTDGKLAIDASYFGKTLSIVKKGDGSTTADSAVKSLAIPARPNISSLAIDNSMEQVTVPTGYYYGTTSDSYEDITTVGMGAGVTVEPSGNIYIYKAAVTEGDEKSFKSEVLTLTAPVRETTPSITIDYENETLSTTTDIQYLNGSDWTGCTAGMAATAFGWNGTAETKVKFRASATDDNYASESTEVTIPVRPSAPTDSEVEIDSPTSINGKGSITAKIDGLEYSLTENGTYTALTKDTAVDIDGGTTVYVRKSATSTVFKSASSSVTIPTYTKKTFTITFDTDGGSSVASQTITEGERATMPTEPTKTGYKFVKWQKDNTDYDFNTAVESNITLTAVWEINKYNIMLAEGLTEKATVEVLGDKVTAGENNTWTAEYGSTFTVTITAKGENVYTEDSVQVSNTTKNGENYTVGTADMVISASFTDKTYRVTKSVSIENGDISFSGLTDGKAKAGTTITVTATPTDNTYKLTALTVSYTDTEVRNIDILSEKSFTVPSGVVGDITVTPTFARKTVDHIMITPKSTQIKQGTSGNFTAAIYADDNTDLTDVYKDSISWSIEIANSGTKETGTAITPDSTDKNKAMLAVASAQLKDNAITVKATIGEKVGTSTVTVTDADVYAITIADAVKDYVSTDHSTAAANTTITISLIEKNGYRVKDGTLKVTKSGNTAVTVINNTFTMPTEAVTITAELEKINYTIETSATNGTITVTDGKTSANVSDEIRFTVSPSTGYQLKDASIKVNDGAVSVSESGGTYTFTMPAENVTITAEFEAQTYTVTYNKDDGTIENESNYTSYTYGVGLTLPTPLKDGYTFDGWYDNESCTGTAVTLISDTDTGNKAYYARWTQNVQPPTTYTVIITGGKGIDNVKLGTKDGTKSGNTYTFTDIEAGEYIFDVTYTTGYEKAADSPSGITVSAGKQTETISAQKKKYTVTFKIEGQEDTTVQVEHGSTAERHAPQSPTKEGYHFVGWVKGTDTTQGVVMTWDEITANGTIYTAKFEENAPDTVTVTFSAGEGGTLTGNVSKTITKGGSLAFADIPTASKTGYDFIGWSDGTTTYTVTELLDKDINENTTLTAQYTIKQYTVTFDTDGGDAIDAVTQNYNTTITLPTPTREGYTFVKWNDGMTDHNAGDSYTITGDVTLTASWTQNVQPPTPTYLDVLDAFADKLTIEKITDDAGVTLVITPINGETLPMLKMYSAAYCADETLASVTLQEITVGTDGKVTITLANPNLTPTGLNFKFFLWNDKMEPIIDTI